MTDPWSKTGTLSSYGRKGRSITPSDDTDLDPIPKAIVVTASGTLSIVPWGNEDADTIDFGTVSVGFIPPYIVRRVMSTNTTASVAAVDG